MKMLLTGASGQLGREWQHYYSRKRSTDLVMIPYRTRQLDITHFEEVAEEVARQQPDVVLNCAAYTRVDEAEEHRQKARQVNAGAVRHLAALSARHEFLLVHYSTDYVFAGKPADREQFPDGYPEEHAADPVNWYGATKWEGEQAVRSQTGNHLIIRLSWLCGQFGHNFVKTMLRLAKTNQEIRIVSDQWGSPTFAANVVENTLALIRGERRGTYHLCCEGLISWFDFATAIFEEASEEVETVPVSSEAFATRARRPRFSKLDTRKLASVPGARIVGWKEGLRNMLAELNTNH